MKSAETAPHRSTQNLRPGSFISPNLTHKSIVFYFPLYGSIRT
jgi:hypothetical protein